MAEGNIVDEDVIARRAKPDVAIRIPFGTPMRILLQRRTDCHASVRAGSQ